MKNLINENNKRVMLTGVRPTGRLTLGNYLGAIRNFVSKQYDYESYIFLADLHAITEPQNPKDLLDAIYSNVAIYLACGVDPEKVVIFKQSDVLEHGEMGFIMTFECKMGELSRMTQYKFFCEKYEKTGIGAGLFVYPPLMSADILLYNTNIVPVGKDQQQHLELTRDLAQRMNKKYGKILVEPDVYVAPIGNRITNLQNPLDKMNKSDTGECKGTIFLLDDIEKTRKKIMQSTTDNLAKVHFDEENQPGISNLMSILSCLTDESFDSIESRYTGKGYGEFKKEVADVVCSTISEIQKKYKEVFNEDYLDTVFEKGAKNASLVAGKTLLRARKALGLTR